MMRGAHHDFVDDRSAGPGGRPEAITDRFQPAVPHVPRVCGGPEQHVGNPFDTKNVPLKTGAMVPFKFGSSDGLFNLGSALAFAQSLPHGVFIAMNGRYFRWDNVRKNKKTGDFEEKQ